MSSFAPSASLSADEEAALKAALQTPGLLRKLPAPVERDFRRHYQSRSNDLLRRYALPLLILNSLALLPVYLFRQDSSLIPWLLFGGAPMATALLLLAISAHLPDLDDFLDVLMSVALFACLLAALFCSMYLDGQYFGNFSKFLTIYVLVASFAILQEPVRMATPVSLGALLAAILLAWAAGTPPFWLEVVYYAIVPLLMCTVTGYSMESSERRSFVQRRLIEREAAQLAQMHAEAEASMRQQRYQAEFLALIGGNHSLKELFTRTLRFLVEHTGAQVAAGYHLGSRGQLRRVAGWALDGASQQLEKKELEPGATLMGPALDSGEMLQLRQIRADYLNVDLAMGNLPCASLLILPIVLAGRPLAVIELGKVTDFSPEEAANANAIRTHLAYAVSTANAREIALRATTA
ncbi:MAG: hypothetical protein K0Q68_75 [Moraxellaceae bacterium]|jgi:hypothetical protein|nr:hypothetical protein [Moraxellaceae bacterium]